ncbi:sodium-dependent nutrient amino acid transporter 1-like [Epargyreus clarus]|uniref:sodium-dependent nutrient amino acid transporter 1-like n=1 Tax=Epargyreus clarus TaxID=520877 RepID=UPI003C2BDE1F
MFDIYKLKVWFNWPSIRPHICTVAVALSFNSTWRVPRDAFRYGGVAYALVFSAIMLLIALPTALLQLAIGQLSQQDAVGVWNAVPFFRGVGYLRLLISFVASIYTVAYVAIVATYFFYSLNNSIPFWSCPESLIIQEINDTYVYNVSICENRTVLPPLQEQPEYYMAMAFITLLLWVLFPIVLYSPVKLMKKALYGATPLVLILGMVIVTCIGVKEHLSLIYDAADWLHFVEPKIWHSSIIQALWSTQIAGGYLISAGDSIYSCTDVQWSTAIFVGVNILASWCGLILWYGVGGDGRRDTSIFAVIAQTFKMVEEKELKASWPPVIFAFLFLSGIITVFTQLYPLYDRFKRVGGYKWRYLAVGSSAAGAGAALAALGVGPPVLTVLDDAVVPLLVSTTTVLEICPFIFIYGWRLLIEDIEFLVGRGLTKYWMWSWCAVICIILPFTVWWLIVLTLEGHWMEPPWVASGMAAAIGAALVILVIFAVVAVARQVQYDVIGKLKSSFRPSRHWGPRDPITHYYWLARREDPDRVQPRTRYHRRQLGQFSGNSSFLNISHNPRSNNEKLADIKRRSNSDDWLYTYRKQYIAEKYQEYKLGRKRSKSLDWALISNLKHKNNGYSKQFNVESSHVTSMESVISMPESINRAKHI